MLIASYLYAIGIILFPFYIFPSGTPQPAHILLLLGAIIAIVKKSQSINLLAMPAVKILVLFVGYVCIVNLVNAIIFGGMSTSDASSTGALPIPRFAEPLAYASFYVFNLFILLGAICLCTEQSNHTYIRFWKIIMISIVVSLLIQTALDLIGLGRTYKTSFRHILYFNNPNQLGYYAVAASSILFIAQLYQKKQRPFLLIAGYGCALYIAALSLSKAALIAIFFFPIIYILQSKNLSPARLLIVALGGIVIVGSLAFLPDEIYTNVERRLSSIGTQQDDNLEARAYSRIEEFPEYLAFGAGEGLRAERFNHPNEIHSLYATVIFSYGIIGTSLFVYFIIKLFSMLGFQAMLTLLPAALYNMTHNGIRSPLLWLTIAMMVSAGVLTNYKKNQYANKKLKK